MTSSKFHIFTILTVFSGIFTSITESRRPNVCKRWQDYLHADGNKNCYYEEDYHLSVPDLIRKYTGTGESHQVTTEDGYILTMFRIPRKNPKGVVLLQHAVITNCLVYLLQGQDSMAYFLWRNGYEVWLNNQRGTRFSRHVNLTESDLEYWNWSFHEIGYYDIDAQVKYMRKHTDNSKYYFYGYSLGTTDGLVYSSLRPKEAEENFRVFIYIGLTCYYKSNNRAVTLAAPFVGVFRQLLRYMRIGSVFPLLPALKALVNFLYYEVPIFYVLLNIVNLDSAGMTVGELDPTLFGKDFFRLTDNFSTRLLWHLYQLMNAKTRFEMYDFGKEINRRVYGQDMPKLYPIKNITTPTYIIYSKADQLTTAKDSLRLYNELQPEAKIYGALEVKGLNHEDYNFGIHKKEWFMEKMLGFMNKIA